MIREQLDKAIADLERANAKRANLIGDLTEKLVENENSLSCLRTVRNDMDANPERMEALDWLVESLKVAGVRL